MHGTIKKMGNQVIRLQKKVDEAHDKLEAARRKVGYVVWWYGMYCRTITRAIKIVVCFLFKPSSAHVVVVLFIYLYKFNWKCLTSSCKQIPTQCNFLQKEFSRLKSK